VPIVNRIDRGGLFFHFSCLGGEFLCSRFRSLSNFPDPARPAA
jgi:hypothetical protein